MIVRVGNYFIMTLASFPWKQSNKEKLWYHPFDRVSFFTEFLFPEALSPAFIHAGTDLWPHPLSFANAEQLQQLQQQALLHQSIQQQLPVRSFLWLDQANQAYWPGEHYRSTHCLYTFINTLVSILKILVNQGLLIVCQEPQSFSLFCPCSSLPFWFLFKL